MINLASVNVSASINQQLSSFPSLFIKREDEISPYVSGNKYRKLILNLTYAKAQGFNTLLTFGGAYSNHIAAVSFAAKACGFDSIGVIRGEELAQSHFDRLNPTLQQAVSANMQLHFVSRTDYQKRYERCYQETLIQQFSEKGKKIYLIPEGGTNPLAIEGCFDILKHYDECFDFIACPVGTGGTISGLIHSAKINQTVLGFPALEGDFLQEDINNYLKMTAHLVQSKNAKAISKEKGKDSTISNRCTGLNEVTENPLSAKWHLIGGYTFGGYGKTTEKLIDFMNEFYRVEGIKLDPIYTGKMVYGIYDMLEKGSIPSSSKVLMIHTGGLQGIDGFNQVQQVKNKMPLIYSSHQ